MKFPYKSLKLLKLLNEIGNFNLQMARIWELEILLHTLVDFDRIWLKVVNQLINLYTRLKY